MSSIGSPLPSSWGALGAPDWRHSAPLQGPQPAAPAAGSASPAATLAGWFDAAAAQGPALTAQVSPAARGLSAAQHAQRVLGCLCG